MQQISNLVLILVDLIIKFDLNPQSDPYERVMDKVNNCIVLVLAQLIYVFMGIEPDQELKYSVGYVYDGLVMSLVGANLAVGIKVSFKIMVLNFKF
jgi:hypothetical protein